MEYVRKAIGCLALLAAIVTAAAQTYGTFGPLLDQSMGWPTDCLAVHAVHMPGGNVLLWGKRETDTRLYVRNSFTGLFLTETTPTSGPSLTPISSVPVRLFCRTERS